MSAPAVAFMLMKLSDASHAVVHVPSQIHIDVISRVLNLVECGLNILEL